MDFTEIEFIDTNHDEVKVETVDFETETVANVPAQYDTEQTKCGEIFTSDQHEYIFVCGFCTDASYTLEEFGRHIRNKHVSVPAATFEHIKLDIEPLANESLGNLLLDGLDEIRNQSPTSGKYAIFSESTTTTTFSQSDEQTLTELKEPVEDQDEENKANYKKTRNRKRIPATCNGCGKTFRDAYYVKKEHRCPAETEEELLKKFTCGKCHEVFPSFWRLKYHYRACTGARKSTKLLKLDNCPEVEAESEQEADAAERVVETSDVVSKMIHKRATCNGCPMKPEESLRKFSCPTCNQDCFTYRRLRAHRKMCPAQIDDINIEQDETCNEMIEPVRKKKRVHKPATCKACGKTFRDSFYLNKEHRCPADPNDSRDKFTCKKCNNRFFNYKHLKKHVCEPLLFETTNSVIVEDEKKSDDVLKEAFEPQSDENATIQEVIIPNDPDLYCNICEHQFRFESLFRKHALSHNEPCEAIKRSSGYLQCWFCDTKLANMIKWREHELTHRTDEDQYKCPQCSKCFRRQMELKMHINSHRGERPYKCNLCPLAFAHRLNLHGHIKRVHLRQLPFACEVCGKRFLSKSERRIHMQIHTGEKPFQCEQCGRNFMKAYMLRLHQKRHTNTKDIKCPHCDQKFFSTHLMTSHMVKHFDVRPFACEICGSTFKRKKALGYHRMLHSDKKAYVCSICGKEFAQPGGLYSHRKTHAVLDFNKGIVQNKEET